MNREYVMEHGTKMYEVRLRDANVDDGNYTESVDKFDTLEEAQREVEKLTKWLYGDKSITYYIEEVYVLRIF